MIVIDQRAILTIAVLVVLNLLVYTAWFAAVRWWRR